MGPYDSLREYAAAMEEQGQLMRIREMDQDRYEMTAFGYRLDDRMRSKAPAFIVECTKINDRWYDTPVISNVLNSYGTVAQALGAEGASDEEGSNYTAAVTHIMSFLDADHRWAKIEPVFVERSAAPCKEVILTGDDADLYRFPWIRNNPADGGQYISTGAVVTDDPELGRNVGTHRMMIKGPQKLGLDLSTQSHAYKQMIRATERGEKSVPYQLQLAWIQSPG